MTIWHFIKTVLSMEKRAAVTVAAAWLIGSFVLVDAEPVAAVEICLFSPETSRLQRSETLIGFLCSSQFMTSLIRNSPQTAVRSLPQKNDIDSALYDYNGVLSHFVPSRLSNKPYAINSIRIDRSTALPGLECLYKMSPDDVRGTYLIRSDETRDGATRIQVVDEFLYLDLEWRRGALIRLSLDCRI